ncbi:Protein IQ-DOMAIN 14 [Glycine max]|nr:Protein IQ-DOMAIN 14 [Glycine max]
MQAKSKLIRTIVLNAVSGRGSEGMCCVSSAITPNQRSKIIYIKQRARKYLHRLRGFTKLKIQTQGSSAKKQAVTTITYLHSWSKIQAEITARRICMVAESSISITLFLTISLNKQQVEWCSGSETKKEILSRLHQREEAAVKRERTMAYAFSH